jgi:hypothetical protein
MQRCARRFERSGLTIPLRCPTRACRANESSANLSGDESADGSVGGASLAGSTSSKKPVWLRCPTRACRAGLPPPVVFWKDASDSPHRLLAGRRASNADNWFYSRSESPDAQSTRISSVCSAGLVSSSRAERADDSSPVPDSSLPRWTASAGCVLERCLR